MSFNIGKILRAAKKIKVEPPREEIKVPKKPETARRVSSFREKTFKNKKTSAGRKLRRKKQLFSFRTPKAIKIDHVLLSKIKEGKLSGKYRYTSYFLRDKDTGALSAEELSKVRSLLNLEKRINLLNSAYFKISRPQDIYTGLLDSLHGKEFKDLLYHKAKAIDDKLADLNKVSMKVYEKLLTIMLPAESSGKFKNLFFGFFPSPELLMKNIEALEKLPPAFLDSLHRNCKKICFEHKNTQTYKNIDEAHGKIDSGHLEKETIAHVDNAVYEITLHEVGHMAYYIMKKNKNFEQLLIKYSEICKNREEISMIMYMLDPGTRKKNRFEYDYLKEVYKNHKIKLIKREIIIKHGAPSYFDYVEVKVNGKLFKGLIINSRTPFRRPQFTAEKETFPESFFLYYAEKEKLRRYDPELFQFMEKFDRRWRKPAR